MAWFDSLTRLFGGWTGAGAFQVAGPTPISSPTQIPPDPKRDRQDVAWRYHTLWTLYRSVGMYEELSDILHREGLWKDQLFPLRNPANRIVEFHASKLWPGANLETALPIENVDPNVAKAIMQTWKWSNFARKKQAWARRFAAQGDLLVKVVGQDIPDPKVYYQLLNPENATVIKHDDRGFLSHIRLDVPQVTEKDDGTWEWYWYTEIWDQPANAYVVWKHKQTPYTPPRYLGQPVDQAFITDRYGIDFIPIVQGQFRDVDEDRGDSAFGQAFDKIIEADRMCTKLHSMAFRHSNVTMAFTAGGVDANMAPLPPPMVDYEDLDTGQTLPVPGSDLGDGTIQLGDDRIIKLGGNGDVKFLVPNLPYSELAALVENHMHEIERDCPEMAYYRLREMGSQLSARAVRLLLDDAIARGREARGNGEEAIIRANKMALTLGQRNGAFPGLTGSFDGGTWDHTFADRPFIEESDLEMAQAELQEAQAKQAKSELGVPDAVLQKEMGYTDEEIARMAPMMQRQKEQELENSLTAAMNNTGQTKEGVVSGRNGSNGQTRGAQR